MCARVVFLPLLPLVLAGLPRVLPGQEGAGRPPAPVPAAGESEAAAGGRQDASPAASGAREPCPDCGASGKVGCPTCGGRKKLQVDCPVCDENGKQPCTFTGCQGGRKKCGVCRGTGQTEENVANGQVTEGKNFKRAKTNYKQVKRPCRLCSSGTVPCSRCDKGLIRCTRCRGTKLQPGKCDACGPDGKVVCIRCNGEGRFETTILAEPPQPHQPRLAPTDDVSLLPSAANLLEFLWAFGARCDKLLKELKERRMRVQEIAAEFEALVEGTSGAGLDAKCQALRTSLATCQGGVESAAEAARRLEEQQAAAGDMASRLRSLDRRIQEGLGVASEAQEIRAAVQLVGQCDARIAGLERHLQALRGSSTSLEASFERLKASRQQAERKLEEEKAILVAFSQFQAAFTEEAAACGLPGIKCSVRKESRIPADLRVQVSYFDPEAEGAGGQNDPQPTEDYLEKIPALLDGAFEVRPDVSQVVVVVQGTALGRTGHREPRQIQSFTASRADWNELRSGDFRSDWRKLLSLISPDPQFPRGGFVADPKWLVIGLVGLLFGALSLALVARIYMLK